MDEGVLSMWKRISVLCIIAGLILLSACSDKLATRIERAFELSEQESYSQAIELLQKVLQDDPENIDALALLQAVLCEAENFEQSIVHGKAILKIEPNTQAYQNLAYAYRRLEQYEDAISSYESLLVLSPENEGANEQLGIILAGQSRYDEAIEPLKKVLRLKGADTFLLQTLGICHMRLQRYEQAIDAFERIIKTEKTPELLSKARLSIGDVYYTRGAYNKAIEQYAMITQDQSTYRLAQHYIKALNGVSDDAKRKIIIGVPFPPRSDIAKILLGTCGSATLKMALNFLNDPISQKPIAEAIKDNDGTDPYSLWDFAVERGFQAYLGIADLKKIKYWVNRGYPIIVSILDPQYGEGHSTLVVGYDELKDVIIAHDVNHWIEEWEIPIAEFQHAWDYYGRSSLFIFPADIDLPPNFEANIYAQSCLQTERGRFLYDQGNKEAAFIDLEVAVLNQPPLPIAYAALARIFADEPSKNTRANQHLSTALTMGPPNGFTLLHAGVFYKIRNENIKALSVLKKGLELYPNAYELRQKLASVYIKLRDHANAAIELEILKTQCKRKPYCRDQKEINNDLFVSNVFLRDYGKAIEANQELIELSSTLEEKYQVLGKHTGLGILHKQPEVVRESLRQILDLLPEDDPKRQGWNELLQALDKRGMRIDVKLEKDTERGQVKFIEFYTIKSDVVADSIVHAN